MALDEAIEIIVIAQAVRAQARPEQYHRALFLLQEAGESALLSAEMSGKVKSGTGRPISCFSRTGVADIECLIVTQVSVGQDGILRALAAGDWGDSEVLDIGHYSVEKC